MLIGYVSDANLTDNCGPMLVKIVQNTSEVLLFQLVVEMEKELFEAIVRGWSRHACTSCSKTCVNSSGLGCYAMHVPHDVASLVSMILV